MAMRDSKIMDVSKIGASISSFFNRIIALGKKKDHETDA
jgi:hypothetical protein